MALQRLAGFQEYMPNIDRITGGGGVPAISSILLDAAADRVTFVGRFVHKDRTVAKTVDGVGFLLGAVGKANGSTFQASLQDVSLTTGPPYREDGTPDQTLTIANADAGFVSNVWYEGAFGGAATRSLTHGDRIAVVLQFASFVAGDTVNICGVTMSQHSTDGESGTVANLTGTYAGQLVVPNVVLRCSDGTYGTIEGALPFTTINFHPVAVNTGTADEYAMGLQFPYPVAIDGLITYAYFPTAGDTTELLLYSGTTVLATVTIDHNAVRPDTVAASQIKSPISEVILAANTLYRVSMRPTATNIVYIYSFDVNTAAHFQCHVGSPDWHLWTRLNQGAWGGEVATRRLFVGVRPSAFDDGAGAGGIKRIIGG